MRRTLGALALAAALTLPLETPAHADPFEYEWWWYEPAWEPIWEPAPEPVWEWSAWSDPWSDTVAITIVEAPAPVAAEPVAIVFEPEPAPPQPEPVFEVVAPPPTVEVFEPAPAPVVEVFVPPPPPAVEISVPPIAPALAVDVAPSPSSRTIPSDLYRVTEPYVRDEVISTGDGVTWRTVTEHRVTETWARVLVTVGTGERSEYDGAAFNGRPTLSDGRPIAGTFYENWEWVNGELRMVSVVFFMDDSERFRRREASPPPTSAAAADPRAPGPLAVPTTPAALPAQRSLAGPAAAPGVADPEAVVAVDVAPLPLVRIGVDPSGGSGLLHALEVARGRRYELRVNVRSEGAPVTLEAWSFDGGPNDAPNPGGWRRADEPLLGQWLRLAPPGTAWRIVLRVRLRTVEGAPRAFEASDAIEVRVRSPAVVE